MSKKQAALQWKAGQPYSALYDDVYFSTDSGIDETQYVFIQHNQLESRFQSLTNQFFTIIETGFGTGLNFLCTWALWHQTAPRDARLHFISAECHPLTQADLSKALALWPTLTQFTQQLIEKYQYLSPGWHRLGFEQGRVQLTLLIGDVNETLPQLDRNLETNVDAWFLDGFSPAKNPEMWQPCLFNCMAKLSHAETTFATFTSAGLIKRGLEAAGFIVKKSVGFGKKREMLYGKLNTVLAKPSISTSKTAKHPINHAIVIGGGIAGAATSHALAQRGWQVTLLERHATLAQEASGNPSGVLYPRLTNSKDSLSQFALAGYLYSLRQLEHIGADYTDFHPCGVLQLAFNLREQARCASVMSQMLPESIVKQVDANAASDIAGVNLEYSGLYFPYAGWVNPSIWCYALTQHENINARLSTQAISIKKVSDGWQVWDEASLIAESQVVVITSANDSMRFAQSAHCALEPVRGQISLLPATVTSRLLNTVVCTEGYITPVNQGLHCIGATFDQNDCGLDTRESDHISNLEMLKQLSSNLHASIAKNVPLARVALRCTTKDHFPVVGQLLNSEMLSQYLPRYNDKPSSLPWLKGLYINAGHGSKGLISAPLSAEILACIINNEPVSISRKLLTALEPNRFLLRSMGLKRLAATL